MRPNTKENSENKQKCQYNDETIISLQIFIQLSPTLTKLCHIKCDHPACVSADGGHFVLYDVNWVVALYMA